ncbi:CatB-related O-acetyltransferase [Phytobacter sp. V91]|uniref:CatB-related O-acetyltransferase n=1 Tax=Phytobacter sp. V91 TaxID=3369425 RepID=UPI003F5E753B
MNNSNQSLPSVSEISSLYFRMSRDDGSHSVEPIRLNQDGSIYGHYNKNETSWRLDNGNICFLNEKGIISTRFDQISYNKDKLVIRGHYLLNGKKNIIHVLEAISFEWDERIRPRSLTRKYLSDKISVFGWSIGDHTYGRPTVLEPKMASLTIGKFCSIAGEVVIILGNHRINTASTYPFKTLSKHWPGAKTLDVRDHFTNGDVIIGNDVWIGHGSTIMSGISIGDGAVIAANSLVNKNVPPYAIVGGTPARIIRYRHDKDIIDSLLSIQWWQWSDEDIDNALPYLLGDIKVFVDTFGGNKNADHVK